MLQTDGGGVIMCAGEFLRSPWVKFVEMVGDYVQIHCVDPDEPGIEWWEWGIVDHATADYLVLKDEEDLTLVERRDVKEIFAVEGRRRIYRKAGRPRKKSKKK